MFLVTWKLLLSVRRSHAIESEHVLTYDIDVRFSSGSTRLMIPMRMSRNVIQVLPYPVPVLVVTNATAVALLVLCS